MKFYGKFYGRGGGGVVCYVMCDLFLLSLKCYVMIF